MFDTVLYLEYDDRGSSTRQGHLTIATSKLIVKYQQFLGNRSSDHGEHVINILYPSESLDAILFYDHLFLNPDYSLQFGERKSASSKDASHLGTFFYGFDDKETWENEGRKGLIRDDVVRGKIIRNAEKIVQSFKQCYETLIEQRSQKILQLYPITPDKFFSQTLEEGIGTIFNELYHPRSFGSCCAPEIEGGNGFSVGARTSLYELQFEYTKNSIGKGNWEWEAAEFTISKACHGFQVTFDEQFVIHRIQEIGSPNILVDKMYVEEEMKEGIGKDIHDALMRIFTEFRKEFSVDDRIASCESLTHKEMEAAEKMYQLSKLSDRMMLI